MTYRWLSLVGIGLAAVWTLGAPGAAIAHDSGSKFRMMDTDNDGKVTVVEFEAGMQEKFRATDTNGDGQVTVVEMDAARAKMGKPSKVGGGEMSSKDKIKKMDSDGNGSLSADEHAAGAKVKFNEADANKDGALSKGELQAAYAKKDAQKTTQ
jgi:Ca2+-binding EF-hand superfamily protein